MILEPHGFRARNWSKDIYSRHLQHVKQTTSHIYIYGTLPGDFGELRVGIHRPGSRLETRATAEGVDLNPAVPCGRPCEAVRTPTKEFEIIRNA